MHTPYWWSGRFISGWTIRSRAEDSHTSDWLRSRPQEEGNDGSRIGQGKPLSKDVGSAVSPGSVWSRGSSRARMAPQNSPCLQRGGHERFCSGGQPSAEGGQLWPWATDEGHLGSAPKTRMPGFHNLKPQCNQHPCMSVFRHVYSTFLPKNEYLAIELFHQIDFICNFFFFKYWAQFIW